MVFTVELKKDYALRVLEDLEVLDAIKLTPTPPKKTGTRRTFSAISVATQGFKFNR